MIIHIVTKDVVLQKKEWWDDGLTLMFKEMQQAEHAYIKAKKHKQNFKRQQAEFKLKHDQFDNCVKRKNRAFNRERCMQLEEINSSDPNCFWEYINKLGPKNKTPTPTVCCGTDGLIIYEENFVMNKWKEEFLNLYNPNEADGNDSQNRFKDFIIKYHEDFEKLNGDDDMAINSSFTPYDVGKVISKSKANKAPGIDGIVYDI